ncbi:MAG: hypothetical protein CFE62_006395, partial [Candidatus Aquirickettsiella gammari]
GFLAIVEYLITEKKIDLNARNPLGWTLLDKAAYNGQLAIVKYLLSRGYNLEEDYFTDIYFLNSIALNHHFSMLEYLLTVKKVFLLPTLWELLKEGYLGIIQYLIEKKNQPVNTRDSNGWTPLHSVAANGHLGILEYLIHQGADLSATDNIGDSTLDKAIKASHLHVVKYLINEQGLDVNTPNRLSGQIPLHLAATSGRLEIIKYLISQGADLSAADNIGDSTMDKTIKAGHLHVVKYLINEQGLDVNTPNRLSGQIPLHLAADSGRLDIIRYLLDQGADLSTTDTISESPLDKAIKTNRLNTVSYLIEHQQMLDSHQHMNVALMALFKAIRHAQLDIVKNLLKTQNNLATASLGSDLHLLHYVVSFGHIEIIEYLLEQGYNLEAKDIFGNTPLHVAVLEKKLNAVKYLLDKGANLKAVNNLGETPFQVSLAKNNRPLIKYFSEQQNEEVGSLFDAIEKNYLGAIQYLIEDKKIDVQALNKSYKNVLLNHATTHGKLNIIQYLVAHGFDIFPQFNFTSTPLHTAVTLHRLDVVKYYIAQKAPLEAQDNHGNTALHLAAGNYDIDILSYLVESGANLNTKNKKGDSPLHQAVLVNDLDTLKFLIEKGSDLNVQNQSGDTPFHLATKNNHSEIALYLLNKGALSTTKYNIETTLLQPSTLSYPYNESAVRKRSFENIRTIRKPRSFEFKKNITPSVMKNRDTIYSAATRLTYWLNDFSNNLVGTLKDILQFLFFPFSALSTEVGAEDSCENIASNLKKYPFTARQAEHEVRIQGAGDRRALTSEARNASRHRVMVEATAHSQKWASASRTPDESEPNISHVMRIKFESTTTKIFPEHNNSLDVNATILLLGTIASKVTRQALFFKLNSHLKPEETRNLDITDMIKKFSRHLENKKFNNNFSFSNTTKR